MRGPPKGTPKPPTSGRKAGALNRVTRDVKASLEAVFAAIGGEKYFAEWARGNPGEFYAMWVKLLPRDIHVSATMTLEQLVVASIRREEVVTQELEHTRGIDGARQDHAR